MVPRQTWPIVAPHVRRVRNNVVFEIRDIVPRVLGDIRPQGYSIHKKD